MGEFEKLMLHLGLGESPVNEKLREMAALRSLRKGDQMSCADKTRYVYFLISGVMRGYIIDNNGREITDCFVFKYGQGYMDFLEAGISDMPTEWLEAETEVELMCFDAARLSPIPGKRLKKLIYRDIIKNKKNSAQSFSVHLL